MGKGIFIIAFAIFIDGLQAALAWMFVSLGAGLQAITPVGGATGGAIAGFAYCYNATTGVFSAIAAGAKCAAGGALVGAAASAFGVPLGIGLGFVSDVCISLTLGAALIFLLAINKMYYPGYIWAVFIGEAMPGLDVIPGWTFLAIRCVMKKNSEEKRGASGLLLGVATAALSPNNPISIAKSATGVIARTSSIVRNIYESEPAQEIAQERQRLVLEVGREITRPSPPSASAKPNVQPA